MSTGPLLDVILGYDCNLHCDYCTITDAMRATNMSTSEVQAHIDDGARHRIRRIAFTGGEPTIRDDLVPLIEYARARGFRWVKLQSNGLRYAYEPYLERILGAGVDLFHVTISHTDPSRRDRLTEVGGSFDLFQRGLRALVAHELDPVLDVILKEDTYRDLPELLAYFHREGVRRYHLWLVSLTDKNVAHPESLPRVREMFPYLARAFDYARRADLEVMSLHIPRCMLPGYEDHVWDVLTQEVRVVTPEAVFDLKDSKLTANAKIEACRRCVHDGICSGVRRDYVGKFGDHEIRPVEAARASFAP